MRNNADGTGVVCVLGTPKSMSGDGNLNSFRHSGTDTHFERSRTFHAGASRRDITPRLWCEWRRSQTVPQSWAMGVAQSNLAPPPPTSPTLLPSNSDISSLGPATPLSQPPPSPTLRLCKSASPLFLEPSYRPSFLLYYRIATRPRCRRTVCTAHHDSIYFPGSTQYTVIH